MKITKETLKKLIMEEIGATGRKGEGNAYPGYGHMMNFPTGEKPDNKNAEPYSGREPYETGPVETHIKDGEMYVTQGKNKFHLIFDNEQLTSGRVVPIGEYKFTIDVGGITWFEEAPANVRFDANLEKQILDFSGREE
jgi:hypothetical protein